ncbi:nucleotidyltransferase domain-containing protein [Mesorhizobium sp.]|uniref:nucleotidyltransferase domain-containing protein n=1 Tax=Mesorhizobium sp. TaxID=1871066 RepID=UPI003BAA1B34
MKRRDTKRPATVDEDAWRPWHPTELAQRLGGLSKPWCIVGGWALDVWHGRQTRDHEDLEFTILREDFGTFRRLLKGMRFHTVASGVIKHLPARRSAEISQIWCGDIQERRWRVDMMIEPGTSDLWVYKRDASITRPRAEMVEVTPDGLPYLKPAAVLLFKAKYRRDKHELDFANALPKLVPSERAWLKGCLATAHPDHEWSKQL